MNTHT